MKSLQTFILASVLILTYCAENDTIPGGLNATATTPSPAIPEIVKSAENSSAIGSDTTPTIEKPIITANTTANANSGSTVESASTAKSSAITANIANSTIVENNPIITNVAVPSDTTIATNSTLPATSPSSTVAVDNAVTNITETPKNLTLPVTANLPEPKTNETDSKTTELKPPSETSTSAPVRGNSSTPEASATNPNTANLLPPPQENATDSTTAKMSPPESTEPITANLLPPPGINATGQIKANSTTPDGNIASSNVTNTATSNYTTTTTEDTLSEAELASDEESKSPQTIEAILFDDESTVLKILVLENKLEFKIKLNLTSLILKDVNDTKRDIPADAKDANGFVKKLFIGIESGIRDNHDYTANQVVDFFSIVLDNTEELIRGGINGFAGPVPKIEDLHWNKSAEGFILLPDKSQDYILKSYSTALNGTFLQVTVSRLWDTCDELDVQFFTPELTVWWMLGNINATVKEYTTPKPVVITEAPQPEPEPEPGNTNGTDVVAVVPDGVVQANEKGTVIVNATLPQADPVLNLTANATVTEVPVLVGNETNIDTNNSVPVNGTTQTNATAPVNETTVTNETATIDSTGLTNGTTAVNQTALGAVEPGATNNTITVPVITPVNETTAVNQAVLDNTTMTGGVNGTVIIEVENENTTTTTSTTTTTTTTTTTPVPTTRGPRYRNVTRNNRIRFSAGISSNDTVVGESIRIKEFGFNGPLPISLVGYLKNFALYVVLKDCSISHPHPRRYACTLNDYLFQIQTNKSLAHHLNLAMEKFAEVGEASKNPNPAIIRNCPFYRAPNNKGKPHKGIGKARQSKSKKHPPAPKKNFANSVNSSKYFLLFGLSIFCITILFG